MTPLEADAEGGVGAREGGEVILRLGGRRVRSGSWLACG